MLQYACKETLVIQGDLAVVDLKGGLWFLVLQKVQLTVGKEKKVATSISNIAS